jgi:hypothetical protein
MGIFVTVLESSSVKVVSVGSTPQEVEPRHLSTFFGGSEAPNSGVIVLFGVTLAEEDLCLLDEELSGVRETEEVGEDEEGVREEESMESSEAEALLETDTLPVCEGEGVGELHPLHSTSICMLFWKGESRYL